MKQNFISTSDAETRDKLLAAGFELVNESSGHWTFLNNVRFNFEENKIEKIAYTDKLCI